MTDRVVSKAEWLPKVIQATRPYLLASADEQAIACDKIAKAYGPEAGARAKAIFAAQVVQHDPVPSASTAKQQAAATQLDALLKAEPQQVPAKAGSALHSAIPLGFQYRRSPNGFASSLMNAELAIDQLGIDCRYDEFHDKMILNARAFSIDAAVFEHLDNFTKIFRREVARQFGFELTPRDALDALTLRCFERKLDPVRDYLDGLVWDRCERVDRWLIDYCGAEDMPRAWACWSVAYRSGSIASSISTRP